MQCEQWAPELPAAASPLAEQQETWNKMQIRWMVCLTPTAGNLPRAWDKFQSFWHASLSHLTGISPLELFLKRHSLSHGTIKEL